MSPNQLLTLVVMLVAGFVLLCWGWLGRRINDHPVCRDCKFDLDGVWPDAITCPECGSGLKRDGAVRDGVRRRMWPLVLVGLLVTLTPIVPLAAVVVAAITGRDLDRFKPVGLLLWEAGQADVVRTEKIADELMTRTLAGTLAGAQLQDVITFVLDLQGDVTRPWAETWGDLIVQAELMGVLTSEQSGRFQRQQPVFAVSGRTSVHAGSTVPLIVTLKEMRCDSRAARTITLALGNVKVNGRAVDQEAGEGRENGRRGASGRNLSPFGINGPLGGLFTTGQQSLGTVYVGGKRGNNPFGGLFATSTSLGVAVKVPEDLAPGPYELTFDLENAGGVGGGGFTVMVNGRRLGGTGADKSAQVVASLKVPLTVQDKQTPLVEALKPDAALREAMRTALTPRRAELALDLRSPSGLNSSPMRMMMGPELVAKVAFATKDLPAPVAFDVFLKNGDREYALGPLTKGKTLASLVPKDRATFYSSSFTMMVNGQTVSSSSSSTGDDPDITVLTTPGGGNLSETVDVILRPSPVLAASTTDLTQFYGEEIVFPGVKIDRSAARGMLETTPRRRSR